MITQICVYHFYAFQFQFFWMEYMVNPQSHPSWMEGMPIAIAAFPPRVPKAIDSESVQRGRAVEVVHIAHNDNRMAWLQGCLFGPLRMGAAQRLCILVLVVWRGIILQFLLNCATVIMVACKVKPEKLHRVATYCYRKSWWFLSAFAFHSRYSLRIQSLSSRVCCKKYHRFFCDSEIPLYTDILF